jgi:hypothetical protein
MANKQRAIVEIELDKVRQLRFTLNALELIEDNLGVPLAKMAEIEMKIKNVKVILWAGLLDEDKDLTVEYVGGLVDLDNFEYVQEQLGKAFGGTVKNSK